MANEPLSILIIEDSEDDTELLVRLLRNSGYDPRYKQVWTEQALRDSLDTDDWDLIISDFFMPNFSGVVALKIVKELRLDIPFIVLSGVVGEDKAVEMMLAGAHDYVMKNNMSRLLPAIRRELNEANSRRAKVAAERELEKYRDHLEELVHERTKDLQNAQLELLRKERMAVLGQLVATVSHEICNPLGVIRNAIYLLGKSLPDDNKAKEYVKVIEHEVDAANSIIANLSETTRTKSPNRQEINLDSIVDEVMAGIKLSDGKLFHYYRNPRPYTLFADRMQLKQVMNNLIVNAVQATGQNGRVIVLAGPKSDYDVITIVDTGEGIREEIRESIFDPLFTTKSRGTGLGLWISKEIIDRHKGKLQLIHHSNLSSKELQMINELKQEAGDVQPLASPIKIGACFQIQLPHLH